jgi:hypothetical protein
MSSEAGPIAWVVLDSNVFAGRDRYLESTAGQLVRDESASGRLRIAVPEVVMIESDANHRRALRAARDRLLAARAELDALRDPQTGHDFSPRRRYRDDLYELVSEARGVVLPIPDTSHEVLIGKAVARKRPFDENGGGYRDALIWDTVLLLLDEDENPVVLISGDRAAFSKTRKTPELASDLTAELRERGHAGRVGLYFELSDFTSQLPRARELARVWTNTIAENQTFTSNLTKYLLKAAQEDMSRTTVPKLPETDARNVRFLNIRNPRQLRVAEAFVPSNPRATSIGLDVALTVDYTLVYERRLADPIDTQQEATWRPTSEEETAVLTFEVLQHDRNHPDTTTFGARLVAWGDTATWPFAPARDQSG